MDTNQREILMSRVRPLFICANAVALLLISSIGQAQAPADPGSTGQSNETAQPAAPLVHHKPSSKSDSTPPAGAADKSGADPATTTSLEAPTPHNKSKKSKKEPEEEWVLLPEPVKAAAPVVAAQPSTAPGSSALTGATPGGGTTGEPSAAAAAVHDVPTTTSTTPVTSPTQSTATSPAASTTQAVSPTPAASGGVEQRLALIIGNSNYEVGHLPNSLNDAQSIAALLKQMGWQVIERENVSKEEMTKSAEDFGNQLASGGGVGLFYYAGHGIQSGNLNYLIPVDADIQDEDELPAHAYESGDVLRRMERAKNRLNVVILDACRNNPFASRFSSVTKGLAGVQPGSETPMIISYATMPGATAADGTAGNGLYTSELLHAMSQMGLGVEDVFKEVRSEVKKKSGGKQIPYENSSLTSDFYFNPTPEQATQQPMLANNGGSVVSAGKARSIVPVLVSQKLFQNYQHFADLKLPATVAFAKFIADGSSFLTVTSDHGLRVWDISTGIPTRTEPAFGAPSLSLTGRYLLGQADSRTLHLLDTETLDAAVKTYLVPNDIEAAGVSPDARRLLVYTKERGFFLMDTASSSVVGEARKVDGSPQFAFSPAGNRVLLWGSNHSDLYLWDTDSGKRVGRISAHSKPNGLVRFSKDGSLLLTAADGDSAIVSQAISGTEVRKLALEDGNPLPVQAEFIDGDKHVLMNMKKASNKSAGDTGFVLGIWDVATGKPVSSFPTNAMVKALQFSPDGARLFTTGPDNSTRVFDMSSKTQVDALNGAELLGFAADGHRLIAHDGESIRLYEARTLTPIARMPNQSMAFLGPKAGNLYATTSTDGKVRLVDFDTGDVISTLEGHIDPVTVVRFGPDGKRLVTFSDEKVAKVWALPAVRDISKLVKDSFESSAEYQKRVADWSSDYTTLVTLGAYNADAETYTVNVGKITFDVPMPRDDARHMAEQREAILTGKLKFYDADRLQLSDAKLSRIP